MGEWGSKLETLASNLFSNQNPPSLSFLSSSPSIDNLSNQFTQSDIQVNNTFSTPLTGFGSKSINNDFNSNRDEFINPPNLTEEESRFIDNLIIDKNDHTPTNYMAKEENTIRGPWTFEEDNKLIKSVTEHGEKKWCVVAKNLYGRDGKQCRDRWLNHLRSGIKKDAWTEVEEDMLIEAHRELGNRWAQISGTMPWRPENTIKNHWNAISRKLISKKNMNRSVKDNIFKQPSMLEEYIKTREPLQNHRASTSKVASRARKSKQNHRASTSKAASRARVKDATTSTMPRVVAAPISQEMQPGYLNNQFVGTSNWVQTNASNVNHQLLPMPNCLNGNQYNGGTTIDCMARSNARNICNTNFFAGSSNVTVDAIAMTATASTMPSVAAAPISYDMQQGYLNNGFDGRANWINFNGVNGINQQLLPTLNCLNGNVGMNELTCLREATTDYRAWNQARNLCNPSHYVSPSNAAAAISTMPSTVVAAPISYDMQNCLNGNMEMNELTCLMDGNQYNGDTSPDYMALNPMAMDQSFIGQMDDQMMPQVYRDSSVLQANDLPNNMAQVYPNPSLLNDYDQLNHMASVNRNSSMSNGYNLPDQMAQLTLMSNGYNQLNHMAQVNSMPNGYNQLNHMAPVNSMSDGYNHLNQMAPIDSMFNGYNQVNNMGQVNPTPSLFEDYQARQC